MEDQGQRHFGCGHAIIVITLGLFAGLIIGWLYGNYAIQSIVEEARRKRPDDPLDMLFFVSLTYIFLGAVGGTITGTVTALILYLRSRSPDELQESSTSS